MTSSLRRTAIQLRTPPVRAAIAVPAATPAMIGIDALSARIAAA
jgi:hypothetical protein